ncbi:MAG: divergent polysaccharide deacetylase family protein [Oleispira sp.]|nr:divergent polysaccharide deacetylase family protein [Oleispira sp.]MBL4880715.1 divergent polysaccharide deacetylase family protein [Oleispira sp.]
MIHKFYQLVLSAVVLSFITLTQAHSAQLVIIIDDIGNNYAQGNAMVELAGPLTLAFLPHTPYAKRLANKAHLQQKEIILHAPMGNTGKAALGPGALTQELTEIEFKQTLKKAIASIPHIQGINNHMGSALTQDKQAMQWVMETLQDEQLYFIDSLTSPNSVAYQQALAHQLPALRRHIFLDNDKSEAALTRQWNKALRIAHKTGRAILIAHPYGESHAFLSQQLPKLASADIELVPASLLFLQYAWQGFELNEPLTAIPQNRYQLLKQHAVPLNKQIASSQGSHQLGQPLE